MVCRESSHTVQWSAVEGKEVRGEERKGGEGRREGKGRS